MIGLIVALAYIALATGALIWVERGVYERHLKNLIAESGIERGLKLLAQAEADGLKKQIEMQAKAIEASSLPWYPKNDRMEARFEADAIDKFDNPSLDYADVVQGLGGTH